MQHAPQHEYPLIGITTGEIRNANHKNDKPAYGQINAYSHAIANAGGIPVLLPYMEDSDNPHLIEIIHRTYERMDGIVLAGGNDISPQLYTDDEPHPTLEDVSRSRDETELILARRARIDKKPLLAICRGMQLWNAEQEGTLHQNVPDLQTDVNHVNPDKDDGYRHLVSVEEYSTLARIMRLQLVHGMLYTNSYHHQAIKDLGEGLRAVAHAEDGIIEAIETTDEDWDALGVQSHPEADYATFAPIFGWLVEAASSPAVQLQRAA